MWQIYMESFPVDRINAVCEQLAGFIVKEILDPRGEFFHDGHINRVRIALARTLAALGVRLPGRVYICICFA